MHLLQMILLVMVVFFNISCSTQDYTAVNEIIENLKITETQLVSAKGSSVYEHIYPNRIQDNCYIDTIIQNGELFTKDELLQDIPFDLTSAYQVLHGKEIINFAFQHDQISMEIVDISERSGQPYLKITYDGEKRYGLGNKRDLSNNKIVLPGAAISNDPELPYPHLYEYDPRNTYLTLPSSLMSSRPISETLEYARDKRNCFVEITGNENVGIYDCIVLKMYIKRYKRDTTLWLSPENNYLPVKIHKKSSSTESYAKITYKKYDNDICFPSTIIKDSYHQGKYTKHSVQTFNDDWEINSILPDSTFVINFPKGIMVYDETTGERYIQE